MTTPREVLAEWFVQGASEATRELAGSPRALRLGALAFADDCLALLASAGFRVLPVSDQPRGEGE